jgi:DNA-binding NarL/FixJ family response regulator
MANKKVTVKKIKPIDTVDEFENSLSKMATTTSKEFDPVAYFKPKIDVMSNFALGMYQWTIADFGTQKLVEVGGMGEEMTGKPESYWSKSSPEKYLVELAPPDELPYIMAYIKFIYETILSNPYQDKNRTLHPHIYINMKNKEGVYRPIVMQFIDWYIEKDGGVRHCLCQITDISHLKSKSAPKMTILEVVNGSGRLLVSNAPKLLPEAAIVVPRYTNREKEVISLLAKGFTSKLIAGKLGIAHNTVENHRQNLLKKSGCYTSAELTAYAINNGLI